MKPGLFWVCVSVFIVLVLVLSSCGQTAPQEIVAPTTVQGTVKQTVIPATTAQQSTLTPPTATTSSVEMPKYGGISTILWNADALNFDDAFASNQGCYSLLLTNEELWSGDWSRGPAGTGEATWASPGIEAYPAKFQVGILCDSWEVAGTDSDTLIFHIRKGVNWQNKPPTNGRELTADDVLFSLKRAWTIPTATVGKMYKPPLSLTAPDKYTVVIKYASFSDSIQSVRAVCDFQSILPRDAVEKYGDLRDWRNSVGTGPFILTDYVKASSMTLVRNPNYWDKDPVGPGKGNQLPYLDGVKILVIPDVSTLTAAMRTGKGDRGNFGREDAASLRKTNPELMWTKVLGISTSGANFISFRLDNPAPWTNQKVRQALHLSIDYQSIVDGYYNGDAIMFNFPAPANIESRDFFIPLDQYPQNIQDLFKYQPDKAKQMLADAGYPNGFDMRVLCRTTDIDLLSIYKANWAKIGVNLILDAREYAVYSSARASKGYKDTCFTMETMNLPLGMEDFRIGRNMSYITDARVEENRAKSFAAFWDWPERCKLFKEIAPYLLEICWYIPTPSYYNYIMWQPWLKNYHGEESVGNNNLFGWVKWVWIDQNLKQNTVGSK